MGERCFCHLNGLAVKDAVSRKKTDAFTMPELYGAVGDGVTDDSKAFHEMFSSGHKTFLLSRNYLIEMDEPYIFHKFIGVNGITIKSINNAKIDLRSSNYPDSHIVFLEFDHCNDIDISINAQSNYNVFAPTTRTGISPLYFIGCENVNITAHAKNVYTVVCFISNDETGENVSKNIRIQGSCEECCYFLSAVAVDNLDVKCRTNKVHRSVYIGASENVTVDNVFTKLYVADCNVLLTTGNYKGKFSGVKNAYVKVRRDPVDMTTENPNGTLSAVVGAAGISSQEYTNLVNSCSHENITFELFISQINTGGYITAVHDIDISTKNVKFIIHDFREIGDADKNNTTIMTRAGQYISRVPVEITFPEGWKAILTGTEIQNSLPCGDVVTNSKGGIVYKGNIKLKNSICEVNTLSKLELEGNCFVSGNVGMNGFACTVNDDQCQLFTYVGGSMTPIVSDQFIGKTTAYLYSLVQIDQPIEIKAVNSDGTSTLLFKGYIGPTGKEIHFPALTTNSITCRTYASDPNSAAISLII